MRDRCPSCGFEVPGGLEGCQAVFNELGIRVFDDPAFGKYQRMMVDAYCLQHPDAYCASAKSLAAHLVGLCCAFEHGGNPAVLKALNRWLNGTRPLVKPEIPSFRGSVTIDEMRDARDAASYKAAVERWARSAWDAYSPLHPTARAWLAESLARR